ncbi:Probable calcium-binding protein CML30 [Striga hermonthica]|uniref:Probable calcium-binding protein CML30 n=1 Tax=Striga hermonthica TaxID=68872 RepID=A0A9N7ND99_STRHE|nr:Probable calcium-binding protein CML30 [Striga hermonthica]
MPLINLTKLRILDTISINLGSIQLAVLIVGLIELLVLLDRKKVSGFFLGFYSLLLTPLHNSTPTTRKSSNTEQEKAAAVCRGDLEVVLKSLGLFREGNIIPARLDSNDILKMFEEKSVGLGEIKEAFDVFDENRDGFIDAMELRKVLCALGFREGLDVERCSKMIGAFDENRDGKIDFDEFVKFMGNSF